MLASVALLLSALIGCEAAPARGSATVGPDAGVGPATPGAATPSPATTSPATTSPALPTAAGTRPAVPAYVTGAPPAERPGRLADATAAGPGGWVARLWFGGVQVERDGGRPVVGYAAIELSSDGTRTIAHTKLTLFHCVRREAAGSPNFVGCAGREVEYGDLEPSQLRAGRTAAGGFTVTGSVPTYTYGGAVDRGPGLPVRWTGRTFPVRVSCAPDPEPVCRPGRPGRSVANSAVVLGSDPVAGRAGLDFGYLNRLTR